MSHFGLLNVNKPAGLSSRDVVDRVERLVRPAKAGHAGTLDPLAMGVLVICVGQATRLIQNVQQMPKRYRATFLLGRRSETDDIEGDIIEIAGAIAPSRESLDAALRQFIGPIQQRPPAHSAVKIAGRRAYKLARAGKTVALAAREVVIHRIDVLRYEYPELELDIECGSGTYVRALGRDLAEAVGTGAVMSALERTAIGVFRVADAVAIGELSAATLEERLLPAIAAVPDMRRIELTDEEVVEIRHGRPVRAKPQAAGGAGSGEEFAAVDGSGQLVAILHEKRVGQFWPERNFF